MALRDQPYLPLYVQDFISDEKLRQCSAESVGVYIFLMCILHKSESYGSITLNGKYFASLLLDDLLIGFAEMLLKLMPFTKEIIEHSLRELLAEKVINIDGNRMFQKRMVRDGEISLKRAIAGFEGGKKSRKTTSNKQNISKTLAKSEQNTENEYEIVINTKESAERKTKETVNQVIDYLNEKSKKSFKPSSDSTIKHISARIREGFLIDDFKRIIDYKCKEWLGDQQWDKFVRPETLFGTKAEGYLQAAKSATTKQPSLLERYPVVNRER
jgi:uncharacterized phage protein (TIGR02220 family)